VNKIAFCTTCKGRLSHLIETLPKNIEDNKDYPNCIFVVVDYGYDLEVQKYILTNFAKEVEEGTVVFYSYPYSGKFRMAHAKNMAHRLGILHGADILVNMDADNFTGKSFAKYVSESFDKNGTKSFLWSNMIPGVLPRGISGRIAVNKEAFLKAGGYDERYAAWGRDDKDFNERLTALGYQKHEIDPAYLLAIRHNDKIRFKEYPHIAKIAVEDEEIAGHLTNRVVNEGNVGTGTVIRCYDGKVIDLKPIPARIFNIGWHKTGTTSLNEALNILGLDSVHWPSAHWAKRLYNEVMNYKLSPTVESHYSLTDMPVGLMYRELDTAYPGSKFILTIRNSEDWLNSVERHWNPEFNKYRANWDTDPFTHKLHSLMYGRKKFDAEIFLSAYRKHNSDVLSYFYTRKQDLLILDMDSEHKWEQLCEFLEQPIPDLPYPAKNITK